MRESVRKKVSVSEGEANRQRSDTGTFLLTLTLSRKGPRLTG